MGDLGSGSNGMNSLLVGWIVAGIIGPMFELAPAVCARGLPVALLAAEVTWTGARARIPIILAAR
jgi:hypothetical protein